MSVQQGCAHLARRQECRCAITALRLATDALREVAGAAQDPIPGPLTPKELAIVRLLADGHDMAGAASVRGVSLSTVKAQILAASRRVGTHTAASLVAVALRKGWIR